MGDLALAQPVLIYLFVWATRRLYSIPNVTNEVFIQENSLCCRLQLCTINAPSRLTKTLLESYAVAWQQSPSVMFYHQHDFVCKKKVRRTLDNRHDASSYGWYILWSMAWFWPWPVDQFQWNLIQNIKLSLKIHWKISVIFCSEQRTDITVICATFQNDLTPRINGWKLDWFSSWPTYDLFARKTKCISLAIILFSWIRES